MFLQSMKGKLRIIQEGCQPILLSGISSDSNVLYIKTKISE